MIYPIWRLSEDTPDNLGLACTDDGLLLGRTSLIERRGGRFFVRERSEIARLLIYTFPQGCAVDRIMPGLAAVASALNANDPALARIAAVHLQIPDLPSAAARNAMVAEDALIKYARDEGGGSDWNPALHPRAGVPPNPGWFAPTDGPQYESREHTSSHGDTGLRFAENQDGPRRSDATLTTDDRIKPVPGNPMDEPASFADRFGAEDRPGASDFWSKVWPAVRNWLEEPVPEYDLESGEVVGARPRWKAFAPYVGIPIATAAIFGVEAFAPAIAAWLGLSGGAELGGGAADIAAQRTLANTANGDLYSVAFEVRLSPSSFPGVSRAVHFREANEALLRAMDSDPQFAQMMQGLGVNLERTATSLAPRTPPAGWTWHHAHSQVLCNLCRGRNTRPAAYFGTRCIRVVEAAMQYRANDETS